MICIIALFVFAVLGIFSAKYRALAKEAFDCVFRKVTLRPCVSNLDERLKAGIISKILLHSPKVARIINVNFEALSWIFTILMFASTILTIQALYNVYYFGNCDGPTSTGFCIFNPGGSIVSQYRPAGSLVAPPFGSGILLASSQTSKVNIIEFGCFSCPYTKKAEPVVKQILADYNGRISFEFRYFPLPTHLYSRETANAVACANEQGRFAEMKEQLFLNQSGNTIGNIKKLAVSIIPNAQKFDSCFDSRKYDSVIEKDMQAGINAGIYGTPTFFINGRSIVGPKPYDDFRKIIDEELAK